MNSSTEDKLKGTAHQVKGSVKEAVGRVTDDPDLETEGAGEKVAGKVQDKIGDVKKVFDK